MWCHTECLITWLILSLLPLDSFRPPQKKSLFHFRAFPGKIACSFCGCCALLGQWTSFATEKLFDGEGSDVTTMLLRHVVKAATSLFVVTALANTVHAGMFLTLTCFSLLLKNWCVMALTLGVSAWNVTVMKAEWTNRFKPWLHFTQNDDYVFLLLSLSSSIQEHFILAC